MLNKHTLIDQFHEAADRFGQVADALYPVGWTADHWYQLASICTPIQIEAGHALITAGNTERCMYLLAVGSVEVAYVVRQSLTVSIMSQVGPGSVVGEQAFFDSAPRSANVWAVDNCQLLKINLSDFEKFAEEHPRLGYGFVFALARILAHRLRSTTAKVSH